eukprot:3932355-Rhodomonas_salina.1
MCTHCSTEGAAWALFTSACVILSVTIEKGVHGAQGTIVWPAESWFRDFVNRTIISHPPPAPRVGWAEGAIVWG